ncbi:hypothetical protein M422DRAFT_240410 [Sphaerobolus stellatus SS14]|nr:hypothetical protein M422DRAFT_240410 [Sphaerobolus stellatus SS14]
MHFAIIVLNEMVENGIPILVTTLMSLSRGDDEDPRHEGAGVAWKVELDKAKRLIPDRHSEDSRPYRCYLLGLVKAFEEPQLDELKTVVIQMKEDNIEIVSAIS